MCILHSVNSTRYINHNVKCTRRYILCSVNKRTEYHNLRLHSKTLHNKNCAPKFHDLRISWNTYSYRVNPENRCNICSLVELRLSKTYRPRKRKLSQINIVTSSKKCESDFVCSASIQPFQIDFNDW